MVKRILNFLNKDSNSVNQAALLLAFFAFLAQIIGLIRDRVLASMIGPGQTLDIYYASFKIPDLIFISVASLTSVVVLLPFLAEKINDKEEANRFFTNAFSVFTGLLILVCILAFFLMPLLIPLVAPGFSAEAKKLTVDLSRIMLLSPIFLGLSTMLGALTQLFKKFLVFSLLPIFYNLGILLGVVWFYPSFGIKGLIWGVLLGAFCHFALQLPVIYKIGFKPRFIFDINWKEIRKVVILSLPRTLGLALGNITFVVLLALASKMAEGSISIFNFALHLQAVPITLIGVSYSMAAFPTLSLLVEEKGRFLREFSLAAKQIIFWSMPAIVLFIILRAQIVRVVLGAGLFDWEATRLTAAVLSLLAISIASQSLVLLFTRAFYAVKKTYQALVINLICAVFTVVLAFVFLELFKNVQTRLFFEAIFRIRDLPATLLITLPLASSLGSILNCLLYWYMFKKEFDVSGLGLSKTFSQITLASIIMGVVAYFFLTIFGKVFNLDTFAGILLQGLLSGTLGIASGVGVLWVLGNEELKAITGTLRTKFWKTKVVISEETMGASSGR